MWERKIKRLPQKMSKMSPEWSNGVGRSRGWMGLLAGSRELMNKNIDLGMPASQCSGQCRILMENYLRIQLICFGECSTSRKVDRRER